MVSDVKKKYAKDVVKPKRPLSAYLFYSTQNVSLIKEKEKISHPLAMAKAGEAWNKMNDKQKKKYNDMHSKDVARFESQMKELDTKGYFMMDDGSKSSDHIAKVKKKRNTKGNDEDTEESEND